MLKLTAMLSIAVAFILIYNCLKRFLYVKDAFNTGDVSGFRFFGVLKFEAPISDRAVYEFTLVWLTGKKPTKTIFSTVLFFLKIIWFLKWSWTGFIGNCVNRSVFYST
jgi:hypothetical protein